MFSVELYGRVRHACHVEGLSIREAARRFGIHRNTVRKMLAFSVPPGYRRRGPPARPRLGPFTAVIDRILEEDRSASPKQRHTAKRRPISSSRAESTVNQLVNARMNKRRQMRWSPLGAHRVLQVRAAVLDGRLHEPAARAAA